MPTTKKRPTPIPVTVLLADDNVIRVKSALTGDTHRDVSLGALKWLVNRKLIKLVNANIVNGRITIDEDLADVGAVHKKLFALLDNPTDHISVLTECQKHMHTFFKKTQFTTDIAKSAKSAACSSIVSKPMHIDKYTVTVRVYNHAFCDPSKKYEAEARIVRGKNERWLDVRLGYINDNLDKKLRRLITMAKRVAKHDLLGDTKCSTWALEFVLSRYVSGEDIRFICNDIYNIADECGADGLKLMCEKLGILTEYTKYLQNRIDAVKKHADRVVRLNCIAVSKYNITSQPDVKDMMLYFALADTIENPAVKHVDGDLFEYTDKTAIKSPSLDFKCFIDDLIQFVGKNKTDKAAEKLNELNHNVRQFNRRATDIISAFNLTA